MGWLFLSPYIPSIYAQYGTIPIVTRWLLATSLITLFFPIVYTLVLVYKDCLNVVYKHSEVEFRGFSYLTYCLSSKVTAMVFLTYLLGLPAGLGWISLTFKQ